MEELTLVKSEDGVVGLSNQSNKIFVKDDYYESQT